MYDTFCTATAGEANANWDAILDQLADISRIPSSAMEVLDSGCICTDAGCTTAECNGVRTAGVRLSGRSRPQMAVSLHGGDVPTASSTELSHATTPRHPTALLMTNIHLLLSICSPCHVQIPEVDPRAVPTYPAISSVAALSFSNNVYYRAGSSATPAARGRYVDRRTPPPLGVGYDGGLAGWQAYIGGDSGSLEADPKLDPATYKPMSGSPAIGKAPQLPAASTDYYGLPRNAATGVTDAGAVLGS
jgi:hypothetical protein